MVAAAQTDDITHSPIALSRIPGSSFIHTLTNASAKAGVNPTTRTSVEATHCWTFVMCNEPAPAGQPSCCCAAALIFARTSSMSRSRTAVTSSSRDSDGSAPAWLNTRIPSRNAISVGIDLI